MENGIDQTSREKGVEERRSLDIILNVNLNAGEGP